MNPRGAARAGPDEDPNDASRSVRRGAETRLAPRRKRLRAKEKETPRRKRLRRNPAGGVRGVRDEGRLPAARDPPDAPDAPDPPSGSSTRIIRASFVSSESEPSSEAPAGRFVAAGGSAVAAVRSAPLAVPLVRRPLAGARGGRRLRSRSALLRRSSLVCAALHSTRRQTPTRWRSASSATRWGPCTGMSGSGTASFLRDPALLPDLLHEVLQALVPVRTLHRNDMSLNLTMMSPFTASIAPLLGD